MSLPSLSSYITGNMFSFGRNVSLKWENLAIFDYPGLIFDSKPITEVFGIVGSLL